MPSLRQLSYLVALADELHFRKAAERVNVTQPTLSVQIQQLEKRLKVALVERGQPAVMLTPLGKEIANRARRVISDVEDIVALAAASQHGLHGTIRLGVPPTLGPYLLPFIVPSLHAKYPDLRLYVREGKPADLQLQLQSGIFDLLIAPLPVVHADLARQDLFREPLQIVVSADHPLAGKTAARRQDLRGENVLAIEHGHHLHDQVRRICDDLGANLLRDYEGTSLDTLRQMVGMGLGITFLPALYVRSEIGPRSEVAAVPFRTGHLFRHIALIWRRKSVHETEFRKIAAMVQGIVADRLPELSVLQ